MESPKTKLSSSDFNLIYQDIPQSPKITIIVSKKVAAKAVSRNRIKRMIKETLRHLNFNRGQIIIIVKRDISHLKLFDVKQKLETMLK